MENKDGVRPRLLPNIPKSARWILAGVSLFVVILWSLPVETAASIVAEGGPVETLSVMLFVVAAAIAAVTWARRPGCPWAAATLLLVWACLRELDLQKRFTYRSIESVGYYSRPDAPWSEKLLALAMLAPFFLAGLCLLRLMIRHVFRAWSVPGAWPYHLLALALLVIPAAMAEKLFRPEVPVVEEACELGFAAMILLLVRELSRRVRDKASSPC